MYIDFEIVGFIVSLTTFLADDLNDVIISHISIVIPYILKMRAVKWIWYGGNRKGICKEKTGDGKSEEKPSEESVSGIPVRGKGARTFY